MSMVQPTRQPNRLPRRDGRHRLMTRLGLLAVFLSGLLLAGLMYFETTALAPGRAGLVIRGGELRRVVTDAGHIYRIPVLDHVMLVDLHPQPLPTIRYSASGSDTVRAVIELQTNWQVADAGAYWRTLSARPELGAQLIETELRAALRGAVAGMPMGSSWSAEARQALARALEAETAPKLRQAGLKLEQPRITSVQVIR